MKYINNIISVDFVRLLYLNSASLSLTCY